VHVVGEGLLAADLHHRQELPVAGLEVGVAADVHFLVRERQLVAELGDDRARAVAEMAALGVVKPDLGYG